MYLKAGRSAESISVDDLGWTKMWLGVLVPDPV